MVGNYITRESAIVLRNHLTRKSFRIPRAPAEFCGEKDRGNMGVVKQKRGMKIQRLVEAGGRTK